MGAVGCFLLGLHWPLIAPCQVIPDGRFGSSTPLKGPDYVIDPSLGRAKDANLFHSFSQFNIFQGESATFTTGSAANRNIIVGISGGNPSTIDGRRSCPEPGTNLYLVNPKGLMFGPNASLDLNGSFFASTARQLLLPMDRRGR